MFISILTLFPQMFGGIFDESIIRRAREKQIVDIKIINIRDFAEDRYKSVDDHPYGGGVGMILRVDIIWKAIEFAKKQYPRTKAYTLLLDPAGTPYTQNLARSFSNQKHIILICGHYEGVDERIYSLIDQSVSIGDYILTGGEIAAMVVVDSITRLLPGVLAKKEATSIESFVQNSNKTRTIEYPQYTRPFTFRKLSVPPILLSGNHQKVAIWKKEQTLARTKKLRPDLLKT
ncbi:tRNA (guanosine(37)-N1)-methyltransferase TrmD [Candidatus Gottesmanbacteria bacterium]|nr:tRNA (guanosine(37)-N1)-methyltransferase TrmD [Candidatus Gottesmanbacteria bacterium]